MILDEERIAQVFKEGGHISQYSNLLSAYEFNISTAVRNQDVSKLQIELDNGQSFILTSKDVNGKKVIHSSIDDRYFQVYPCFRGIFPYITSELDCFVHLLVYKLEGHKLDSNNFRTDRNGTWMTKDQLEEHILYCKEELHSDFIFKIFDLGDTVNVSSYYGEIYDVLLYFPKTMTARETKFVLTWIRYAYEFPDTLALLDAYRMKQQVFPTESLFNLFLMSAFLQRCIGGYRLPGDQIISDKGVFMSTAQLEREIKEKYGPLNSIYSEVNISLPFIDNINFPISYWVNPKGWEERLKFYKAYYKYQTSFFCSKVDLVYILERVIGRVLINRQEALPINKEAIPETEESIGKRIDRGIYISLIVSLFIIAGSLVVGIFTKRFNETVSNCFSIIGLVAVVYFTIVSAVQAIHLMIRRWN